MMETPRRNSWTYGFGSLGMDAAASLQGDDGPSLPQVVLALEDGFALAAVDVDGDGPDPGDVAGDKVDHEGVERIEDEMDEAAEVPHVAVEVAEDELARLLPV